MPMPIQTSAVSESLTTNIAHLPPKKNEEGATSVAHIHNMVSDSETNVRISSTVETYIQCDYCQRYFDTIEDTLNHGMYCRGGLEAAKYIKRKGGKRPKTKLKRKHLRHAAKLNERVGGEHTISSSTTDTFASETSQLSNGSAPKRTPLDQIYDKIHETNQRERRGSLEQQLMGHATVVTPPVYMVKCYDKSGGSRKATCVRRGETLLVPRHLLTGCVKAVIVIGGGEYPIDTKIRLCASIQDQCWAKIPTGVAVKKLDGSLNYREPQPDELVTVFWYGSKGVQQSTGVVGKRVLLGDKQQILSYEFKGSTENGTCGGVYISNVDGAIVGFHAIGYPKGSTLPKFFPATLVWNEEFRSFCQTTKDYDITLESEWLSSFEKQIQFAKLESIPEEEEKKTESVDAPNLKQ